MAISLFGSALIAHRSSLIVHLNSHTALCPEGGGECREDGDEDVEDFSPGGVVVESSHSVSWFCGLDISVLRLDFMNKVPVCSFSDAKIRHLFGGLADNGR